MAEGLTLYGFRHSVYTRIVRMALLETGLEAEYVETNPFADPPDEVLGRVTLFDHVPVLAHGRFTLTETGAILRYLDKISARPTRVPRDAAAAARMDQIIGITDAYFYRPGIRKVFAQGWYRPYIGETSNAQLIAEGLEEVGPALITLDRIAQEGLQLAEGHFSLADIHLAPMLAYFTLVPQGVAAVARYAGLHMWWERTKGRASVVATDPFGGH
ncbi:glutathione S-transferase family protein [Sulfitobacter sp. TSTF-M16]|uniref:Glutathione S-transferase family protein n=1 Tax=Sulfitobacter aestuariivivens TaxID=2766981 RepID=A0A927HFV8_9RHOB|nr:glutathione S-transferase family protein [Sulfitobacter aestuariivivens]MBD3664853.1 glutathione S-transferase family protein [Sulfitobacter aestuariivivens]